MPVGTGIILDLFKHKRRRAKRQYSIENLLGNAYTYWCFPLSIAEVTDPLNMALLYTRQIDNKNDNNNNDRLPKRKKSFCT